METTPRVTLDQELYQYICQQEYQSGINALNRHLDSCAQQLKGLEKTDKRFKHLQKQQRAGYAWLAQFCLLAGNKTKANEHADWVLKTNSNYVRALIVKSYTDSSQKNRLEYLNSAEEELKKRKTATEKTNTLWAETLSQKVLFIEITACDP